MFLLFLFGVLCVWMICSAIKGDRPKPVVPPSLPVLKSPRYLRMESTVRSIAGKSVSEEQMNALYLESPHALITARAGSGKTTTIALKLAMTLYQNAHPEHLLALCFNRSAAKELGDRLARFGAGNVPTSTFHALAYAIVRPRPGSIIFGERQHALMQQLLTGGAEKHDDGIEIEYLVDDVLGFISSAKHRGLKAEEVQQRHGSMGGLSSQAVELYAAYTSYLKNHGLLDFNDLLEAATDKLAALAHAPSIRLNGKTCDLGALQLLCIDEFQDFSRSFYSLVKALTDINPSVGVYAVGDDWQAINSFAGSSSDYFNGFDTYFNGAGHAQLKTNYRSCSAIVAHSNKWMKGCGVGGTAIKEGGAVERVKISDGGLGVFPVHDAVRKLIANERGRSVLVLARRNFCHGMDLAAWQKDLSRLHPNVRVSTIHKAKGGEADTVYFLKEPGMKGSHTTRQGDLLGLTGANMREEERRLTYVAYTRARERLVVVE